MRFKKKKIGDVRVITSWCIIPKFIDNEWIWLEKIKVKQQIKKETIFPWEDIEIVE